MKLLAIETSSSACSIALLIDHQVIAMHELAPMQQTQLILPRIEALLFNKKYSIKSIGCNIFWMWTRKFYRVRELQPVLRKV